MKKFHLEDPHIKLASAPGYDHVPLEPRRATPGASGFDLHAMGVHVLQPMVPKLIKTGWLIEVSPGWEAQVRPRSGLALKQGLTVLNSPGTIDSDYRGEIGVILINTSETTRVIEHGDRIAQLVVCPVFTGEIQFVSELSGTERGEGGYGSTGR